MIAYRRGHAVVPLGGMRGHESKALHSIDARHRRKQGAEIAAAHGTAIGVHSLAEELDLRTAGADGVAYFSEHVLERARDLTSARSRHDAERAVLVATFDDRHLRFGGGWTVDSKVVIAPIFREIDRDDPRSGKDVIEMTDVSRPHH